MIKQAGRLVPAASADYAIKTFAANRPASDEQHRLRIDPLVPNLLHVTDRSAGVSISPASAEEALVLLRYAGLEAAERDRRGDVGATGACVCDLQTIPKP